MSVIHTLRPNGERTDPNAQPPRTFAGAAGGKLLLNSVIIALWLWLYWPLFGYLALIFSDQFFRTNQAILIAVIGLLLLQARQGGHQLAVTDASAMGHGIYQCVGFQDCCALFEYACHVTFHCDVGA